MFALQKGGKEDCIGLHILWQVLYFPFNFSTIE